MMNNDTFQELVLHHLGVLTDKIGALEQGQINIISRIDALEQGQKKLEAGQKKLQTSISGIKRDLKCVWEDIKRIDNQLSAQEEDLQMLKSIR